MLADTLLLKDAPLPVAADGADAGDVDAVTGGLTARITDLRLDLRLAMAATISRCVLQAAVVRSTTASNRRFLTTQHQLASRLTSLKHHSTVKSVVADVKSPPGVVHAKAGLEPSTVLLLKAGCYYGGAAAASTNNQASKSVSFLGVSDSLAKPGLRLECLEKCQRSAAGKAADQCLRGEATYELARAQWT